MVVLNLEINRFLPRIPEQLLKLDLKRSCYVNQAPTAHSGVFRGDVRGDQNALVHGLQADL